MSRKSRNHNHYRQQAQHQARQMHLRLAQGQGTKSVTPHQPYGQDYQQRLTERRLLVNAFLRTEVDWSDDPVPYPDDYRPTDQPHSTIT